MSDQDLLRAYNYASFTRENVLPWLNFTAAPPLGETAPDFPLWRLDGTPTCLKSVWSRHAYTIIEFGSVT
ncbi:MAG: hypothetical protein D6775_02445 [Caldilineae bacterium]|nr:MAG: hypothetical protein D6775_02445 [Caldilineae bacterium]